MVDPYTERRIGTRRRRFPSKRNDFALSHQVGVFVYIFLGSEKMFISFFEQFPRYAADA
jgi:hypothetical protein